MPRSHKHAGGNPLCLRILARLVKPETSQLTAPASGAKILLAEDNKTNRLVVRSYLKKLGVGVEEATDGEEVLEKLAAGTFDLVLMDVQMPKLDGLEASRIIRDPESKVLQHDIPIIALTAHAMKGDEEMCLNSGMNGYIAKPVRLEQLKDILSRWLADKNDQKAQQG